MSATLDPPVTLDAYQKCAMRTRAPDLDLNNGLLLAALGASGESGEFAELVKKHVYHDIPLNFNLAVKELGDVLWYVAAGATALGYSLEEVAAMNIAKLQARYPDKFTTGGGIR
jgi:NTP pyrophosphatase (non-canonical NTP hydrolase)